MQRNTYFISEGSSLVTKNSKRIGIVTSLAIHSLFLMFCLMIPLREGIPSTVKTIHLGFVSPHENVNIPSQTFLRAKATIREKAANVLRDEGKAREHVERDSQKVSDTSQVTVKGEHFPTPHANLVENIQVSKMDVSGLAGTSHGKLVPAAREDSGEPAFIHRETPLYPYVARKLGIEGKVVLGLLIDENGRLMDVEIFESSADMFAKAAVEAMKRSTFSPGYRNGVKIKSKARIVIHFTLQ